MAKISKRTLVKIIVCALLIGGIVVFVRDWNGVRLLAVSPEILKYRRVIQKHAATHQLDWRLITALIVQESGFNEYAVSPAGAKGLMQLMPKTAKELGVTDPFEAHQSIAGATRYLRSLYDLYPESSHPNRIRIALASYNGGRGHIKDAQKIAKHREHKSHEWECLSKNLSLLTEKDKKLHAEIWKSGVPPHGYFRGYQETRQYVKKVMGYYDRLCYFSDIVRRVKSVVSL
ncbi:MAG: transglycosylase SLT domain-containing protein [Candidatus Poribacteria bacterium]|nr:transglycosylase SLT domain-containing protein [Candidatus Poribacteria bacterium]